MKKYYFLYETTNLINGKNYIGIHGTNNLDDGYLGSGVAISRAQKLYGKENFKIKHLQFFNTPEEMAEAEAKIVTPEFIKLDSNYNLVPGGFTFLAYGPKDSYDSARHSEVQIKSWECEIKRANQSKYATDIAWKKWKNLDLIRAKHRESCTKSQRKSKAWENYDELKNLWESTGKLGYGYFNKIAVQNGYDKMNYQRLVQQFKRDIHELCG